VAQAESQGVTIALENTRRPDYLDWAFSHIQSSNLGFCYDSSHDFIGANPGEESGEMGPVLTTTPPVG
jgi:sugar phosphate isomerase/epimerase